MVCVFYEEQHFSLVSRGQQETIFPVFNQLDSPLIPPAHDSMQNDYNRFFARRHKIAVGWLAVLGKPFPVLKVQKMSGLSYPQNIKMRDFRFLRW
jgi:hypothetical protein